MSQHIALYLFGLHFHKSINRVNAAFYLPDIEISFNMRFNVKCIITLMGFLRKPA